MGDEQYLCAVISIVTNAGEASDSTTSCHQAADHITKRRRLRSASAVCTLVPQSLIQSNAQLLISQVVRLTCYVNLHCYHYRHYHCRLSSHELRHATQHMFAFRYEDMLENVRHYK